MSGTMFLHSCFPVSDAARHTKGCYDKDPLYTTGNDYKGRDYLFFVLFHLPNINYFVGLQQAASIRPSPVSAASCRTIT